MWDEDPDPWYLSDLVQCLAGATRDSPVKIRSLVDRADALVLLDTRMTAEGVAALQAFALQKHRLTHTDRMCLLVSLLEKELRRHAH